MDILSVIMHNLIKAECHNGRNAHYAEWDYAICHYAECHVDCHGANSICVV